MEEWRPPPLSLPLMNTLSLSSLSLSPFSLPLAPLPPDEEDADGYLRLEASYAKREREECVYRTQTTTTTQP